MIEMLEECYNIGYDKVPDYNKLKFMLKKILLNHEVLPGGQFHQVPVILNQRGQDHDPEDEQEIPDEVKVLNHFNTTLVSDRLIDFGKILQN